MKTEQNIFVAFILNLTFSIIEFFGGIITGSVAIISDSIHDLGDAISIGLSYLLEKKSKKEANEKYTYGYIRYSVLGGLITTIILTVGSSFVIYESIHRIFNPTNIDYSKMIIFAILGVILNFIAAYLTRKGDSINQKSVNLHMLEDVLGWIVVLIGAIIMNFTNIKILDPLMSIGIAIFILVSALKNLKTILDLFLIKTPDGVDIKKIKKELLKIKGVDDIHHIHVWSTDGINNLATMHIVTKSKEEKIIKEEIRNKLKKYNINHAILETEDEVCQDTTCHIETSIKHHHH